MHKKIKFSLDYSDNITTIMTPHVINVKSADPDYQDDLVYEVVLKFSKGYLSRNFIEDFNQDYLDVTELDFSFIEDNKDAFSPIDSETKIYQYTTENTSTHSKKLDFQDAENVAQVLRDNIGIKKISFRGQNIGDEGAYYILKALYNNPKNKVTELDFRGCGITDVTLVILYNFLIDKNSNLKLTNISIDSSFNRSLSFKIINKALNKDDLSGEEEFFMHIDDDRANPFYYIKLLDEKYNLKALSHDNYNLIITNQFLLKDEIKLLQTVDIRKDSFFDFKLANYFLNFYTFGYDEGSDQLLIPKIKGLIEACSKHKKYLNDSDKLIIESQVNLLKQSLPALYPEMDSRTKKRTFCC